MDSSFEKVLSKLNSELSMYLVIPSTLYLHSCTVILGLEQETQSISPIELRNWGLTVCELVGKDRSFLYTNANLELISRYVLKFD